MQKIQFHIKGESPLILHNGHLADPRNPFAKAIKAISGKRKKTDADFDEMARLEFHASLYLSNDDLVIPDYVLEATFINGAKKSKRGMDAKTALFFTEHASLRFADKPCVIDDETINKLFTEGNHTHTALVKVGTSKVSRTRAVFAEWECVADALYDPDYLNFSAIQEIASDAGRQVGIGDWRPKHGRFTVEVTEVN
nr:hypothetical protein [uncultured Mediterranean phage uvMED]